MIEFIGNYLSGGAWLVPLGLVSGGALLGGLAAIVLGPLGGLLGYLAGGERWRLKGAWFASAPLGTILGGALGTILATRADASFPELWPVPAWGLMGLGLGALATSRGRASRAALGGASGAARARAARFVSKRFGMELGSFLCLVVGALSGTVVGAGCGLVLGVSQQGAWWLAVPLGAGAGAILGLVAGHVGQAPGAPLKLATNLVSWGLGSALLGMMVAALGAEQGLAFGLTGAALATGAALMVCERLHVQQGSHAGNGRRAIVPVVPPPSISMASARRRPNLPSKRRPLVARERPRPVLAFVKPRPAIASSNNPSAA